MIARTWRCTATAENVQLYLNHFNHSVLPELQRLPGFKGHWILRRQLAEHLELTVMTLWESMDAVRAFAGADVEQAVVEPAAQAVLHTFETTVTHFEVLQRSEFEIT